ncbi:hypothetical protein CRYUN_Cryun10bG0035500 [Craigia yunnanensis]
MVISVNEFFLNPSSVHTPNAIVKSRVLASCSCHDFGTLKLNVDRTAIGKSGSATVGGVLPDYSGIFIGVFSKHIGIEDSNLAEFMAIKEGLCFFSSFVWANYHLLVVESNSTSALCVVRK